MIGGIPGHTAKGGADLVFEFGQLFSMSSIAHHAKSRSHKLSHRGFSNTGGRAGYDGNPLVIVRLPFSRHCSLMFVFEGGCRFGLRTGTRWFDNAVGLYIPFNHPPGTL
jgi:hypothetical protein